MNSVLKGVTLGPVRWYHLLLLSIPLVLYFGLTEIRYLAHLDTQIVAPHQHFDIVSLTAYVAFVLSIFTAFVLGGLRNRRTTWLAMGMASLSGLFAVHGLATPGFLLGPNVMVGAAAQQSLLACAIFFFLVASENDPTRAFSPLAHRILWTVWSIAIVSYWYSAFFWNAPFEAIQQLAPIIASPIGILGIGLYLIAAAGAVRLQQREKWSLAPYFMAASILLASAVVGQSWGETWRLSWWSYHIDMLTAFLLVLIGLMRTYEEFRTFRLTQYFSLTAAVFLGFAFFAIFEASNSILAQELTGVARTRVELPLLGIVALLLVLLFGAFLFIVYRGDSLLQERQRELRKARQRLETILDAQPDGVVVLTGEGEVQRANPVAQSWLQGEDQWIDATGLQTFLARMTANPNTEPNITEAEAAFGPVTLRARAARFADNDVVVLLHDISRLRELDRMKTDFVSTVSHELRTPLTNIRLYVSLLRKGKKENQAAYLDTLDEESKRLTSLVSKVLDLSRLDSGERGRVDGEPVNLNRLVDQVTEKYQALIASRQMEVRTSLAKDLPAVNGDAAMLTQVMVNLLGNALNYTQTGGSVELCTLRDAEGRVLFSVEDNGPGIPEEDQKNIFRRFYRGQTGQSSDSAGTGLGLAIVQDIVQQHGGEIWLESEVGLGTRFYVTLPVDES